MTTVTNIIEEQAKTGFSQKTQKEWSMAYVELSNGEKTRIFNPIQVGDEVESVDNNGYKNWSKVKTGGKASGSDVEALRKIYKLQLAIYKVVAGEDYTEAQEQPKGEGKPSWEAARQKFSKAPETETPPVDAYIEPSEEPINLDEIPF